jgi:hypothetical protein
MDGPHSKIRVDKGADFLDCGCPIDTALLELWMTKVTAQDDSIPRCTDEGMTPAQMAFTPDNLCMVEGAITAVSGLTVSQLLQPEEKWLILTIGWAMEQLGKVYADDQAAINTASKKVNDFLGQIADTYILCS